MRLTYIKNSVCHKGYTFGTSAKISSFNLKLPTTFLGILMYIPL
jgi:hypothetical protein